MMTTVKNNFPATLLLVLGVLAFTGCSTKPVLPEGEDIIPPEFSAERVVAPQNSSAR